MKIVLVLVATVAFCNVATAMYSCTVPPMTGGWVLTPDGKECPSPVKTHCNGLMISTTSWKRGTHVQSNCASIPRNTAIATFAGPSNTYNGGAYRHAAIFERCSADGTGIEVIDQWDVKPTSRRLIRYTGTGSNGGSNFYTIEK